MKKPQRDAQESSASGQSDIEADGAYRTLTFDPRKYRPFLDGADMTDEQKDDFLEAHWQVIVSFVDTAFDLSPVQQATAPQVAGDPASANAEEPAGAPLKRRVRARPRRPRAEA